LVVVDFTEHGSLTLPPAGQCTVVPTTTNPKRKNVTAGMVALHGANEPIDLMQTTGSYAFEDPMRAAWKPGASLTLQVTGAGSVPAFSTSVDAPDRFVLKSPAAAPNVSVTVERSKDLEVSWEPFASGQAIVAILGPAKGDGHAIEVECIFDGGDGAGAIPSKLLTSAFTAGAAQLTGDSFNLTASTEGSWSVAFLAAQSGNTANGAQGTVLLQLQ
jgi:hypothetical protein